MDEIRVKHIEQTDYTEHGVKYKHIGLLGSIWVLPEYADAKEAELNGGYGTKYFRTLEELIENFPRPEDVKSKDKGIFSHHLKILALIKFRSQPTQVHGARFTINATDYSAADHE